MVDQVQALTEESELLSSLTAPVYAVLEEMLQAIIAAVGPDDGKEMAALLVFNEAKASMLKLAMQMPAYQQLVAAHEAGA